MWMIGVRIRMVSVVMVVTVVMVVVVVMMVTVAVGMIVRMAVIARADPLHVVMVALLRQPHLRLEAEDLRAVLAELAVHVVLAVQDLVDAIP